MAGHGNPRVLSLLPAAAETLWAAGGVEFLVGRGHEDDYPESITSLPVVTAAKVKFTTSAEVDAAVVESLQKTKEAEAAGAPEEENEGLYSLDKKLIQELKPTVILTQGLCSVCAVSQPMVQRIAQTLTPVPEIVSLSPVSLEDIIGDVVRVGKAVGLEDSAKEAAAKLTSRVENAKARARAAVKTRQAKATTPPPSSSETHPNGAEAGRSSDSSLPNVCFMEWTDPIYVGGHWTPQLISFAGGRHPLNPLLTDGGPAGPSIRRTPDEVVASDPDVLIVCPCGLDIPTTRKELEAIRKLPWWNSLRPVVEGRVILVDGHQMFNRSGPRMVDALEFLVAVLHDIPEMIPAGFPWECL